MPGMVVDPVGICDFIFTELPLSEEPNILKTAASNFTTYKVIAPLSLDWLFACSAKSKIEFRFCSSIAWVQIPVPHLTAVYSWAIY